MPESILKASCTSARHAGSFDCLMASLILITMANGRGHCAWWQSCTVPNQNHRGNNTKRKMYAIKQIKICAEYRVDLSGTPGLRPIGLSPGSWQTSLGLGSMSRYSAQILICITRCLYHKTDRIVPGYQSSYHSHNTFYVHITVDVSSNRLSQIRILYEYYQSLLNSVSYFLHQFDDIVFMYQTYNTAFDGCFFSHEAINRFTVSI